MTKRILSFLLALTIALPASVFAIPFDQYISGRSEYMSATYRISSGLEYTETLTENAKYGIQRSFVYKYTPLMGTEIIPSYGDYVYGTYSLGALTKELESEGKRVVGGINGDFYDMSTGVPLGVMISDGEIITSDGGYLALGFDADGKAFISKPQITTTLSGKDFDISIGHINKAPSQYSLYLLTDKFAKTTKSKLPAVEIVLAPYTEAEIINDKEQYDETINDVGETGENEEKEGIEEQPADAPEYFYYYPEKEQDKDENKEQESESTENSDKVHETASEEAHHESDNENTSDASVAENTEKNDTEAVEERDFYAKRYTLSDDVISANCSIKTVVTEIRYDSVNSEIPEGHFVLTAENNNLSYLVSGISCGDELTLTVKSSEGWENIDRAIGVYGGYILRDGEYCDDVEVDHYPYAHPRTAVGVTAAGEIVFYCVDGRQKSSGGLRIDQLSHEMKLLGCVTAVNLDGGGSTTAYAALPGEKFSTLKNSPSGTSERKTANSLLFVNTLERGKSAEIFSIFPQSPYVLAGGSSHALPAPKATDKHFYPIDLPTDFEYEYFITDEETDSQIVDGNIFVSGEKSGSVEIGIKIPDGDGYLEYPAGNVFVLSSPQSFSLGQEKYEISPFDTVQLEFSAEYHTGKIYYDKASIRWLLPEDINPEENVTAESITQTKEKEPENTESAQKETQTDVEASSELSEFDIIAVGRDADIETEEKNYVKLDKEQLETEKLILSEDLVVTPKVHGQTLELFAKVGEIENKIVFEIKEFPFNDSFEHWSARTLYNINCYGLMQGEPDGEELAFRPERNLTKTEFLTILARILYPEIDKQEEMTEETDSENASLLENAGADIQHNEEITIDKSISETAATDPLEEELKNENNIFKSELSAIFADTSDIPEWAVKYYGNLLNSGLLGIIADYDEYAGVRLLPNEYITRKEVLVVLGALCDVTDVDFVSTFTDGELLMPDKFYGFINNALSTGLFEGYEDGTLRAGNNLTRAEAATVILRFCDNTLLK